jgi:hypothetical protein
MKGISPDTILAADRLQRRVRCMAEEQDTHAGIFWADSAKDEFYALSDEDQKLLSDFLEGQRTALEVVGGGERQALTAVWSGDWMVTWDVRLKPKFRKSKPIAKQAAAKRVPLGTYYRLEVLRIWKPEK